MGQFTDRPHPVLFGPCMSLWKREMVRFFRQRTRVIGAFVTPLVIWLMIGYGLSHSFQYRQLPYQHYFFPGIISMMLLFTAIFSTISVIEDRREGFMQAVLVAPVPRMAIVMGKVFGGASIATIQGVLLLCLIPVIGLRPEVGMILLAVPAMFIFSASLTALGLWVAWPMDSTAGFHAVMNLFLMPMWVLSGAVFPLTNAPKALQLLMWINPMTYGQAVLSGLLTGDRAVTDTVEIKLASVVMIGFGVVMIVLANRMVGRPRKDGT